VSRIKRLRPVGAWLDAVAGIRRGRAHRARIPTQPERRARSTPGSASSLPSRVDSCP
jgi:hypothetical protein